MNHIRHIRRLAGVLAGTWLGLVAAAPVAFAVRYPLPAGNGRARRQPPGWNKPPPPGWDKHPPLPVQVHTVVVGGMPGWQIALIAASAALAAAALTVAAYRACTARRPPVAAAA